MFVVHDHAWYSTNGCQLVCVAIHAWPHICVHSPPVYSLSDAEGILAFNVALFDIESNGPLSIAETNRRFTTIGMPIIIFKVGIPTPGKTCLYTKTGPWSNSAQIRFYDPNFDGPFANPGGYGQQIFPIRSQNKAQRSANGLIKLCDVPSKNVEYCNLRSYLRWQTI